METQTLKILCERLSTLGISPTDQELQLHRRLGHGSRVPALASMEMAATWCHRLHATNSQLRLHPEDAFEAVLMFHWRRFCLNNTHLGLRALRLWRILPWRAEYSHAQSDWRHFALRLAFHTILLRRNRQTP